VLLSGSLLLYMVTGVQLAYLSLIPIAVGSGRINQCLDWSQWDVWNPVPCWREWIGGGCEWVH